MPDPERPGLRQGDLHVDELQLGGVVRVPLRALARRPGDAPLRPRQALDRRGAVLSRYLRAVSIGPTNRLRTVRPVAAEINCGPPGPIPNGWIENLEMGTALGTSIIYRCNKDMKRIGASSATCEKSGRWSYSPPQCLCKPSFAYFIVHHGDSKKTCSSLLFSSRQPRAWCRRSSTARCAT